MARRPAAKVGSNDSSNQRSPLGAVLRRGALGHAAYRIGKATARGTAEGNSMIDVEYSSGNIFEDMDVPNADNMKVRAELIIEIKRISLG